MVLFPARTKFRKNQRRRLRGKASAGATINFGEFGLQSKECGYLSTNQIESARKALTHYLKRGGKVWIRIFPHKPVTSKGSQTTMGSGKGSPEKHVAIVDPGMIIFEMSGVSEDTAREALRLAAHKLPVQTKFVIKQ